MIMNQPEARAPWRAADPLAELDERGWQVFPPEPAVADWVDHAKGISGALIENPRDQEVWLRHGGTWFAGVNILPNDALGRLPGGSPLAGAAVEAVRELLPEAGWDKGQLSVVYPGYPKQDPGESDAAHRFRRDRKAAHVDGLLPIGPARRRMIREPHGFVLGIPLDAYEHDQSPLVVWEGSHKVMAQVFTEALAGAPAASWPNVDVTGAYHAARRAVFETCKAVPIVLPRGGTCLIHRLALHGVEPWTGASGPNLNRQIVYFRPEMPGGIPAWLRLAA